MTEKVTLPPVAGRKLSKIVPLRVSPEELDVFRLDAKRRGMTLSSWMRSAMATYLVCGKAHIAAPAGGIVTLGYLEKLKREGNDRLVGHDEMDRVIEDTDREIANS